MKKKAFLCMRVFMALNEMQCWIKEKCPRAQTQIKKF